MTSHPNKESAFASWLTTYLAWIERYRFFVVGIFALVTGVCLINAITMYANLVTDLDELLPRSVRSVIDLKKVSHKLSSTAQLSVVFEGPDVGGMKQFADTLAGKLKGKDPTLVGDVINKFTPDEQDFITEHAPLFLTMDQLKELEFFVKERVRWEKRKKSSFFISLGSRADHPPEYDFSQLEVEKDPFFLEKDGYFISPDDKYLVMLVYMPGLSTKIDTALKLTQLVSQEVAQLTSQFPDVNVGYSGDVQGMVDEHHAVMEDLVTSAVLVMILVLFIIFIYFQNFKTVVLITVSLLSGTIIAFGISYFFVDYLNANTAFLGAIVFGNGINYSIMLMARFMEEKGNRKSTPESLRLAIIYSSKATFTASLAAGCAYGALIITDFRGFNQFGIIGFIGMVCNWCAAYILLPTLSTIMPIHTYTAPNRHMTNSLAKYLKKLALPITAVSVGIIILSVTSLFRFGTNYTDFIETNFSNLRSNYSKERGSGYWGNKVDATFQRYLTPTVILSETREQAKHIADQLKTHMDETAQTDGAISSVTTLQDLLPEQQSEKVPILNDIKDLIPATVRKKVTGKYKSLINKYLPPEHIKELRIEDFPEKILRNFRLADGSLSHLVLAYPKLSVATTWDGQEVLNFAQQVRDAVSSTHLDPPISGQAMISADIIGSITKDGPKATLLAFIIVSLLIIFIFRDWKSSLTIMSSLLCGVLFLLAIMSYWDLKINFLNFIALPITFGIGVDYAVNLFERVKIDGWRHMSQAISHTGGAIILCSLTTIFGYGSLIIADNQGFVSFGVLAVLGEITCLYTAIIMLPCFYFSIQQLKSKKQRYQP